VSKWKQHVLSAPGIAVSMLPSLTCPICAAGSIGVLSSVGFGYLLSRAYLLPISAALLALAFVGLGFRARRRQGFGPMMLGTVAAVSVLLGKFKLDSTIVTYAGVGLLVVSSFWNALAAPTRSRHVSSLRTTTLSIRRGQWL